jgi:hypothetical protein
MTKKLYILLFFLFFLFCPWFRVSASVASDLSGRIVAQGTPEELRENPDSVTGKYL